MTPLQNTTLHALLSATGLTAQKSDLVTGFTNGRSNSSKNMSSREAGEMITYLRQQTANNDANNRMRRKVISMAYEMQWAKPGDWKEAVKAIDAFCMGKNGVFKVPLNKHSHDQLIKLVSQFQIMLKKHLTKF